MYCLYGSLEGGFTALTLRPCSKCHDSVPVGSGGVRNITDRVGSIQGAFKTLRVRSDRVYCGHLEYHVSAKVGSGREVSKYRAWSRVRFRKTCRDLSRVMTREIRISRGSGHRDLWLFRPTRESYTLKHAGFASLVLTLRAHTRSV